MRIRRVEIKKWRNFENVAFDLPPDSSLVCLVGENGTGKSNLLELVAAIAHVIGLSQGVDSLRGAPLACEHELCVTLSLPKEPEKLFGPQWKTLAIRNKGWAGLIRCTSKQGVGNPQSLVWEYIGEDGIYRPDRGELGGLIQLLREKKETHYLYLDANRAYPHIGIGGHEFAEIITRDWDSQQWGKGRAFLRTSALYEEWVRYLVATEAQAANRFMRASRDALENGHPQPQWTDHFETYKSALKEVLPHLRFCGVDDHQERSILFDSAGTPLNFYQLSGGEREIAFLIGQVLRFRLERGLFLIDEPELHLNSDLLRAWVEWLRNRVVDGQTWLATHSMEAAEVAGADSVFVLTRKADDPARRVMSITSLANQPVLQTLSKALGSPAFSITAKKFVWIEGEPGGNEKARFYNLFGQDKALRFLEAGNCHEVERTVRVIRELAEASQQPIKVKGIVDRDFRNEAEVSRLTNLGLHVLSFHEIENLFLSPTTLNDVGAKLGNRIDSIVLVMAASDEMAGRWIFQKTCGSEEFEDLDLQLAKKHAGASDWTAVSDSGGTTFVKAMQSTLGKTAAARQIAFAAALTANVNEYGVMRTNAEFWLSCMGKEVLPRIAKALGLASVEALERAVLASWGQNPELRPSQYHELANMLASL